MISVDIGESIRLNIAPSEKIQDTSMRPTSAFIANSRAIKINLYGLTNRAEIHCGHHPVGVSRVS
jgi:hypothetical protein